MTITGLLLCLIKLHVSDRRRETLFNTLRDLKTPVGAVGRSLGSLEEI